MARTLNLLPPSRDETVKRDRTVQLLRRIDAVSDRWRAVDRMSVPAYAAFVSLEFGMHDHETAYRAFGDVVAMFDAACSMCLLDGNRYLARDMHDLMKRVYVARCFMRAVRGTRDSIGDDFESFMISVAADAQAARNFFRSVRT